MSHDLHMSLNSIQINSQLTSGVQSVQLIIV